MEMTPSGSVPEIVDARVQGLLKVMKLPTIARHYDAFARQSAAKDHSYAQYLLALLEEALCVYNRWDTSNADISVEYEGEGGENRCLIK